MFRIKIDSGVGDGSADAVAGFPDRPGQAADKSELRETVFDIGLAADKKAFCAADTGTPDFFQHKKSSLPNRTAGKENRKCSSIILPYSMVRNDRFDLILGMNYTILNVQPDARTCGAVHAARRQYPRVPKLSLRFLIKIPEVKWQS